MGYGSQVVDNLINGRPNPFTNRINLQLIAAGTLAGMVGGLTFGAGTALFGSGLLGVMGAGGLSGVVEGLLNRGLINLMCGENFFTGLDNVLAILQDALLGSLLAGGGHLLGKVFSKIKNNFRSSPGGEDVGASSVGKCSFSADTPVATDQGEKPIGDLKVGDKVLAYDQESGTTGSYAVQAVLVNDDTEIEYLRIDGEWLETTPEHPFYTEEKGWVEAGDLWQGAHIRKADGSFGQVETVEIVQKHKQMYNLTVEQAHTFFVGEQKWLVHNVCLDDSHVLDGYFNAKGKPVGWHHVEGNKIPYDRRFRLGSIIKGPNSLGVYEVEVDFLETTSNIWVPKGHSSTFFPEQWSRKKVLREIQKAWQNKKFITGDSWSGGTWRGRGPSDILIQGYYNPVRDPLGNPLRSRFVPSGYPVYEDL
jgi:hypothetical protein